MALIDRLAGFGDWEAGRKLPITYFWSCLYEMSKGKFTRAQIITQFALDAGEITELDWLIAKYNSMPTAAAKADLVELINVILIMAEAGAAGYTTNAELVARINAI